MVIKHTHIRGSEVATEAICATSFSFLQKSIHFRLIFLFMFTMNLKKIWLWSFYNKWKTLTSRESGHGSTHGGLGFLQGCTCLQGAAPRGRWDRRLLRCCLRARGFRHIHICMCVCVCVCVYNRFVYSVFIVLHHHRHLQISLVYLVSWILIELEILRSGSGEYLAKHMCHCYICVLILLFTKYVTDIITYSSRPWFMLTYNITTSISV